MENEFSLFKKEKKQSSADNELSESDKKRVQELKKIDREVRTHEQAHLAASGGLARGGASFTYTKGPDGRKYATGGEVSIEISPVEGKPEETIRRMQQVRKAALAPANPSGQDRSVAAKATREEAKTRAELSKPQDDEKEKDNSGKLSVYKNEFQESTFSVTA
ncbi:MAG: putative metalloprotease CJM1_0395 family protein [Candidatus Kapaibacterium sp.]